MQLLCLRLRSRNYVQRRDDALAKGLVQGSTYFLPTTNVLVERHWFKERLQQPGEPTELYIACLRELVQKCEWEQSSEIGVRDELICCIASDRLRERLLFEGAMLTLDKAVTILENYEATLKSHHHPIHLGLSSGGTGRLRPLCRVVDWDRYRSVSKGTVSTSM
ncbi:hypothetical protein HPB49_017498 [Dermacentor silvarum]|uniref:Uncharacterized protein n=1 Tax=Dermacentor silvarum TaxID=543639 RepID=A0ACB8CG72_DERSI|nr:hypothetical protein HPB49_017498 [Dermacentor silvarum]